MGSAKPVPTLQIVTYPPASALDEPEFLVQIAGDVGKQVRRVGVADLVGLSDHRADVLADGGESVGESLNMFLARFQMQRVSLQLAALGDCL